MKNCTFGLVVGRGGGRAAANRKGSGRREKSAADVLPPAVKEVTPSSPPTLHAKVLHGKEKPGWLVGREAALRNDTATYFVKEEGRRRREKEEAMYLFIHNTGSREGGLLPPTQSDPTTLYTTSQSTICSASRSLPALWIQRCTDFVLSSRSSYLLPLPPTLPCVPRA